MGRRGEGGFVAGAEALAFGVLVFVIGTLVVVNGWSTVDAKIAAETAAREAARAVVEAEPGSPQEFYDALAAQVAATVLDDLRGAGSYEPPTVAVTGSVLRGDCVTVQVDVAIPVLSLPLVGETGGTRAVVGRHQERVDPFRSGLADVGSQDELYRTCS